jgi:hypothetical protein
MKGIDSAKIGPWIKAMVSMRARQGSIKHITGASAFTIKEQWMAIHGRPSPSGQNPSDMEWFLKTANLRYQAAFFLMLFQAAKIGHAKQTAIAAAYFHFAHVTSGEWGRKSNTPAYRSDESDYTLPFARAHYLASIFTDAKSPRGERLCFLEIKKCRRCGGKYLAHKDERSVCPPCH